MKKKRTSKTLDKFQSKEDVRKSLKCVRQKKLRRRKIYEVSCNFAEKFKRIKMIELHIILFGMMIIRVSHVP